MTPLVFLDTETTGIHPEREVWEVGMIRRDDTGQRELQFFVEVDLAKADPFGLSVGRFYERHPQGRWLSNRMTEGHVPDPHRAGMAAELVAMWTHGAHVIGSVPSFDTVSLDRLLRSQGLIPAWHYHLIDVENLAVGYLAAAAQVAEGYNRPYELWQDGGSITAAELREIITPPTKSRPVAELLGITQSEEDQHTALGDARWAMAVYDAVHRPGAP